MALTEEQLELLGERLVPLFQQFERAVINDVARRLVKTGRLTETAEIMAETLRDKGFSPSAIRTQVMKLINADKRLQEEIASNTLAVKQVVAEEIKALRENARVEAEGLWEDAGNMAFHENLSVWEGDRKPVRGTAFEKLIEATARRATDELLNLTKTTGFRTAAGDLIRAQQAYTREVNLAFVKVASGAYSYGQAVEEAVRELARSGMRSIDFESGVTRQLDTAVRNAVMTASSQLAGQITMQNVEQTGVEYVEVSAHDGARTGEGHANHAGWQGKVYRVQGADAEYENLEEATGYPSDPKGLCGYNCRHTFYPFWPGISEPNEWPQEPGPFELDGRTYTYYQATQTQRRREREIRALKREEAAFEAAGLKDKAKETARMIRLKTVEYKEFSENVGIRAKTERLRVCEGTGDIRKKLKDNGMATSAVDFSSANNLANGDARLTSMLRSGNAQQTAKAVNEIMDGYGFRESKWSGKVFVGGKDEMKYALGQKEWSCDITIREDNTGNLKTYIHENLHSRSASHFSPTTFFRNRASEEASVELMAQQVCQKAGVVFNASYAKQVNALKEVRTILFPRMSEYDYAKKIFDMPEDMRYTNIVNDVNRYRLENPNMRKNVRDRLNGALAALGGLKEGAKTYE